ncbi:hypothetical protein FF1_044210 [Malus domestica]
MIVIWQFCICFVSKDSTLGVVCDVLFHVLFVKKERYFKSARGGRQFGAIKTFSLLVLQLCRNTRRSFNLHAFWSGLLVPIPISMPLLGKTDLPTGGGNLSSDPNAIAFERAA